MVNKIHFGKRIAAMRRKAGYSQADLAEKLGVTAQAVSKWECGSAVPDIDLLLELSHLYGVTINEMLEDSDLLYQLTGVKTGPSGIAYFVPEQEQGEYLDFGEEIRRGNWIERNWAYCREEHSFMDKTGAEIASLGGLILEIGAGPGGGFMPFILKKDPDASVIISDLSPTVVQEWKRLLDKAMDSPSLHYAVFDFCHMPLKDACIDVISDHDGISNCVGEKAMALKEAYRVLKPGGKLITTSGFVDKETLAALPEHAQKVLLEKRPDIFEDLYAETVMAGFNKIDSVVRGHWYPESDSAIADLAKELGIRLKFTSYVRYCTKE